MVVVGGDAILIYLQPAYLRLEDIEDGGETLLVGIGADIEILACHSEATTHSLDTLVGEHKVCPSIALVTNYIVRNTLNIKLCTT